MLEVYGCGQFFVLLSQSYTMDDKWQSKPFYLFVLQVEINNYRISYTVKAKQQQQQIITKKKKIKELCRAS